MNKRCETCAHWTSWETCNIYHNMTFYTRHCDGKDCEAWEAEEWFSEDDERNTKRIKRPRRDRFKDMHP